MGLGYWGYRYYSPRLGRWVNRDPIEEQDGANVYTYIENAPPYFVDPMGREHWHPGLPGPHGEPKTKTYAEKYADDCYAILAGVCSKYPCCNGEKCMAQARKICWRYVSMFTTWRKDNPGHHHCMALSQAITGFNLSTECFEVIDAQNPNNTHAFAAVFHMCNRTNCADAVLDPWDFLDGCALFRSYDPETHGGRCINPQFR